MYTSYNISDRTDVFFKRIGTDDGLSKTDLKDTCECDYCGRPMVFGRGVYFGSTTNTDSWVTVHATCLLRRLVKIVAALTKG
jgi:hypothetical protein